MPIVAIREMAKVGVVADYPSIALPPNAFSNALNVRFNNGRIEGLPGDEVRPTASTITNALAAIFWPKSDGSKIMVGLADGTIRALDPVTGTGTTAGDQFTATNFTADLSATYPSGGYLAATNEWQCGLFGGGRAVFFNDGVHAPLYCLDEETATDDKFRQFPGWNYDGNEVSAKVIKAFGYSLVAGNLTVDDGSQVVRAPVTVRVSVPAPTGSFPQTWEPGDTALLADEFELNSKTEIVDMAELRGNLFVYCLDSIHTLSISNSFILAQAYSQDHGILNRNCVVEFDNKHLVIDANDVYIHNGSGGFESVLEGRLRDYFFADVDRAHLDKTFVSVNRRYREIWINYRSRRFAPAGNADGATLALVWNYQDNSLTFRELPCARVAFTGNQFIRTGFTGSMTGAFIAGTEVLYGLCNNKYMVEFDGGDSREESISSVVPHTQLRMFAVNIQGGVIYRPYYQWVVRNRLMLGEDPASAKLIQGLYICGENDTTYSVFLATQNNYPPREGNEPILDDAQFTGSGSTFVPLGRSLTIAPDNENSLETVFSPTVTSLDGGATVNQNHVQKARTNGRFFSYGIQAESSADGQFSIPFLAIEAKEESRR
jgi:hypothetical protein